MSLGRKETPRSVLNKIFMGSSYQGVCCSGQIGSQALVIFFPLGPKEQLIHPFPIEFTLILHGQERRGVNLAILLTMKLIG